MPSDKLSQSAIPPGNRQYFQEPAIAAHYDDSLRENPVSVFDQQIWLQKLNDLRFHNRDAVVIDFGCGTGRSLAPAIAAGFHTIGVDLSLPMLIQARAKLLPIRESQSSDATCTLIRSDLLEMPWLADNSADLACCLFSTLGMIRGRKNRQRFLKEVVRVLKPGATFIVHAHNVWHQTSFPGGKRWLIGNFFRSLFNSTTEFGDRYADQAFIASLYLHSYTLNSFRRELEDTGLLINKFHPIPDQERSRQPMGWIADCRIGE
ncbi:MAG: class I SAM-dependent methyltransferase [Pirellulaceae bacterium]|nr:class I SAM-dependent methyltransferase [Pirellulaceae bacterium]